MYATKDLFEILAIVSANLINHVILLSIWTTKIVTTEKKLVDKLVDKRTENADEVKLPKITLAE